MQQKMPFFAFFGAATKLHTHVVVKQRRACGEIFFLQQNKTKCGQKKKGGKQRICFPDGCSGS